METILTSKERRTARKLSLVMTNRLDDAANALCNPLENLTSKKRRSLMSARAFRWTESPPRKPEGEKYVVKLSTLTFRQLIRRLHQAARIASTFKHAAAKAIRKDGPESVTAPKMVMLQDNALLCLARISTEIEYRTTGQSKTLPA